MNSKYKIGDTIYYTGHRTVHKEVIKGIQKKENTFDGVNIPDSIEYVYWTETGAVDEKDCTTNLLDLID